MIKFISVVNALDKIADCVPVVSSVKNIGFLLYQLVHKVNKVANPVNTSWVDDIKIHALSRNDFTTYISIIPFFGNIAAFCVHAVLAMCCKISSSNDYLENTSDHSYEIAAIYLARHPNCSEQKLGKALQSAAEKGNTEIVDLILNSRTAWSTNTLIDALKKTEEIEIVQSFLKAFSVNLTNKEAGQILNILLDDVLPFCKNQEHHTEIIMTYLSNYPSIDLDEIGKSLQILCSNYREKVDTSQCSCINVSHYSYGDLVLTFLNQFSQIDKKYLLKIASPRKDVKLFLSEKYPDLSWKELKPMILRDARYNSDSFKFDIEAFPQILQPDNMQEILNNPCDHPGNSRFWEIPKKIEPTVVQAILERYPQLTVPSEYDDLL